MSILLVMDNSLDADATSYLLSHVDGHVVSANTLAEAWEHLSEHQWSVVVLSAALPDASGDHVVASIRALTADSGIMVLSTSAEVSHKVRAFAAGADDYVVQPYDAAEFVARIQALARRYHHRIGVPPETTMCLGDLQLDINDRRVSLAGRRLERLTPNETRLLHYLMLHAPRMVERQELRERLFGAAPARETSNAVQVLVYRLRQKIEVDPDNPRYIETVRGTGYRFNPNMEFGSDKQAPIGSLPANEPPSATHHQGDVDE